MAEDMANCSLAVHAMVATALVYSCNLTYLRLLMIMSTSGSLFTLPSHQYTCDAKKGSTLAEK